MERIRIGCHEDKLAIIHTRRIMQDIKRADSACQLDLIPISAAEEPVQEQTEESTVEENPICELQRALLEKRIDQAVYDLEELNQGVAPGLKIAAYCTRLNVKHTLVLPIGAQQPELDRPIGVSGVHSRVQVGSFYPRNDIAPIRGDVHSRLKRLDRGDYSALILPCDALSLLGLPNRGGRIFTEQEIVPAVGQGIYAIVTRIGEPHYCLSGVDDFLSRCCAKAELGFLKQFENPDVNPIAAFAKLEENEIVLTGFYNDGKQSIKKQVNAPIAQAAKLGERLANEILNQLN